MSSKGLRTRSSIPLRRTRSSASFTAVAAAMHYWRAARFGQLASVQPARRRRLHQIEALLLWVSTWRVTLPIGHSTNLLLNDVSACASNCHWLIGIVPSRRRWRRRRRRSHQMGALILCVPTRRVTLPIGHSATLLSDVAAYASNRRWLFGIIWHDVL